LICNSTFGKGGAKPSFPFCSTFSKSGCGAKPSFSFCGGCGAKPSFPPFITCEERWSQA